MLKPLIFAFALTTCASAFAQQVAVVVTVPTPPSVTRAQILAGFDKAVPQYRALPGLVTKSFTVNERGFGGFYLWSSRAAAERWFNAGWRAKVKATYGAEPDVRYFDAPVTIKGDKP